MPERRDSDTGPPVTAAKSRPRASEAGHDGQLPGPLRQFLATESGSAALLAGATLLALAWANSPWSDAYTGLFATELSVRVGESALTMDLGRWIDDALMAVFFLVIGLEVRRELSVGELTDRRRLALPLVAGLVGTAVPAVIYLAINSDGPTAAGWGVVIGTDTAFMLGALAVVGPRVSTQLRIFLLTITVIDDLVAVAVIGLAYSEPIRPGWLTAGIVTLLVLGLLGRRGTWRLAPYLAATALLWFTLLQAGLHGAIAGILAGLAIGAHLPRRASVESAANRFQAFRQSPMATVGRSASRSLARAISPNERLQTILLPWSSYVVVPLFALANAGVDLRGGAFADALRSPLTWGIVAGLVIGKPLGIATTTLVGAQLGLGRLPQGVRSGHVLGGATLSGIGFTASLLIAGLAFDDPALRDQAVVGILLAAVLATVLGWVVFRAAALLRGHTDAALPRALDRAVDPARDHVIGPPGAALTLVEYGDFECPFCAETTGVTRQLRERFGDDLRYVYRHLPLDDIHPNAELAARAAIAAARQDRFWEYHDLLFTHQDHLGYEHLVGYASRLGLDLDRFIGDLDNRAVHARVRADVASAEASGARATPTFFINGRRHIGPHDAATLDAELTAARTQR